MGSSGMSLPLKDMFSAPPTKRPPSMRAKCRVLNVIFSSTEIANNGSVAHTNGARRAQAETSSR